MATTVFARSVTLCLVCLGASSSSAAPPIGTAHAAAADDGHALLQTSSSMSLKSASLVDVDSLTCQGSSCTAGRHSDTTGTLLPNSLWFFAMEFVLGALTAKFLLKALVGKGDVDAKGKAKGVVTDLTPNVVPAHQTPPTLAEAARAGDTPRVAELLRSGAKVNAEDAWGCSALHVAAECKQTSVARILLDKGADVNAREAWDEIPLHFAARSGGADMCELLVSRGSQVNAVNADDVTPLLQAAKAGHMAACEVLLDHGGGLGDIFDGELPPVLGGLFLRRCLAPATVASG